MTDLSFERLSEIVQDKNLSLLSDSALEKAAAELAKRKQAGFVAPPSASTLAEVDEAVSQELAAREAIPDLDD